MRLYSVVNKKTATKTYMKFMINVPKDALATLGWKHGQELEYYYDDSVLWFKKKGLIEK